jgi:Flp pilus assembly protein TadB
MPEPIEVLGAFGAGASSAVAVFAIAGRRDTIDAAAWLARRHSRAPVQRSVPWSKSLYVVRLRERFVSHVERAGWKESPERLMVLALALASCLTVVGVASAPIMPIANAPVLGALGFVGGIGLCVLALRSAVARRRRRLAAELMPLLELFTLELSGGGSALSALGSVTTKVHSELASDLRRVLIAAHVVGSVPFEARLLQYSERMDIPALASLGTIMGASREYGTGVIHGVRALATDLRHAQRRELIAHSRRALNHVLIPAAVGVLLPFLAVVMFPAVTALQRNLH